MATPSTSQSTQTEYGPYFCFKCNVYKHVMNEDFTCPSCNLGFIEENPPATATMSIEEDPVEPDLREVLPISLITSHLMNGGTISINGTEIRGGGTEIRRGGTARRSMRGQGSFARRHLRGTRRIATRLAERFTLDILGSGRLTMTLGGRRSDIASGDVNAVDTAPISDGQISGVVEARVAVARRRIRLLTRTSLEQIQSSFQNCPMPGQEIRKIPIVYICNDHLEKELKCCVCLENFNLNDVALQLKCGHMYHKHCILPWLQRNRTCPNCRAILTELPCEYEDHLMHFFRSRQRLLEQDLATPREDMDTDSDND